MRSSARVAPTLRYFVRLDRVELLESREDRASGYWLFTILVDAQVPFIAQMRRRGIAAGIVHRRNDHNASFAGLPGGPLPGVDAFTDRMVCLPVGPWLTGDDVQSIVDAVRAEDW